MWNSYLENTRAREISDDFHKQQTMTSQGESYMGDREDRRSWAGDNSHNKVRHQNERGLNGSF